MRPKSVGLALCIIFAMALAAWLPLPGRSGPVRSYASTAFARCKTVTKKVHGHRKKVRVCKKATPTPVPEVFFRPSDLAVDPHGNVLVAEQGYHQVLTLSPSGTLLSTWTAAGSAPATFDLLYGVALDDAGNVYVTDAMNGVVDKLDPSGRPLAQLSTDAAAPHSFPTLLAVGPNGDLYVSSHGAEAVLHLAPTGALLGIIGKGDFGDPYGITFGPNGNLYVTDFQAGRVREYTPDGKEIAVWGDGSNGTVSLQQVEAIALDSSGDIYVTEQAGMIVKFDQAGHQLAQWGGDGKLTLADPSGIALDSAGNIYIAEYEGARVDKLSPTGQVLAVWR